MEDRDFCKALRLGLHVLLLAALVAGQWPSVCPNRTLRVQRGLTVDIRPLLTISGLDNPQLTHCSFRQLPHSVHLSCGDLSPSWVQCNSSGPLVYRHYGCSSTRELLYLQLLISENSSATNESESEHHVMFSSLEVIVGDVDMRLVYLQTKTVLSEGYEYTQLTPIFPPEWIGNCYYRMVRTFLPTAEVIGMVNRPLPCGYVPREQFLLLENANKNRSVLLEVTGTSSSMPDTLRVLLYANSPRDEEDYARTLPLLLPHSTLQVLQFSHAPVSAKLLPCPHSYRQCVYIFPVLRAGAFVPGYSPSNPHSRHTKFTSEDVSARIVAFIPNQEPLTQTYEYTIFDYAGHLLAQSAIEVTVLRRDWNIPSRRMFASPQVMRGGQVVLNTNYLQFYIPPDSFCMDNTFLSLTHSPLHGHWRLTDGGSLMINQSFSHTYLQKGMLVYEHNGNDSTNADGTVWTVTCDGKSFQLQMTLLIIPGPNEVPPTTEVQSTTLLTFCGKASPLLLDTTVYADPGLHFDVNASEGRFIRLANTSILSDYPFPPYITSSNLLYEESVTTFSIEEVEQNLIWYIPLCSAPKSLKLNAHVPGESLQFGIQLQVPYSNFSLEDFFLVSSYTDLLNLVQNHPLPVASFSPVYITTSFLYTHSYFNSPDVITYRMLTQPQYGHICLASDFDCSQPLHYFTQTQVDKFMVVYTPDNSSTLHNDSFEFELRYRDIRQIRPFISVFYIHAAQLEPLILAEEQLWVEVEKVVTIPLRHFRPLHYQLRKKAVFKIDTPPQFGELFIPNHPPNVLNSSYTFDDLKNNRPKYRYFGMSQNCSDSFTFVASNSTHNISKTIIIAIRQRQEELLGLRREKKAMPSQDNFVFASQDFKVLSDFCPQFVHVILEIEPRFGQLRLFHPSLNTFTCLRNSDMFTSEDINAGRLWYTANYHAQVNVSCLPSETFRFSLSDPQANLRGLRRRRIYSNFVVTFLQPTESIRIDASFNTTDTYILSWLPKQQIFGYVFQPDDIRVDSTPNLQDKNISVKILIKESPKKGWIRKNNQPVTEYYLDILETGRIHYVPNDWWIWVASSDTFTISILLETSNASVFINTLYNHSVEVVWNWVHPTQMFYLVRESSSVLELIFRRRVDNGSCPSYESTFTLGFSPSTNATLNMSCSDQWTGDACIDTLSVSFPPDNCSVTVEMELAQDQIFEAREQLLMYITNCSNCVSNITSKQPVEIIIDDTDDYAFVGINTDRAATHPVDYGCSHEINVREEEGEIMLTLIRKGNVEHEVNVSCYTYADSARGNVDFEHLEHNTTITFSPNQRFARCTVRIYDDTVYERKERFYVYVKPAGGLVNTALSETPLCIYIVYDPSDAPILNFQPRPLVIRESQGLRFDILRSGVNLELRTRVCYQVMENRTFTTATVGVDYDLLNNTNRGSPTQACVEFAPNETVISGSIIVHSDNKLEGTEFVFLKLSPLQVLYGELGWPSQLNITILDGTQSANIGLNSTVFHVNERTGVQRFPMFRSGSIAGENKVLCKLKPINSTAQTTDHNRADFIVPPKPETVTFQENDTIQYCSMYLMDDNVYEGVEGLYLELDRTSQDPAVRLIPDRQRAIIYIHDVDDEPRVWFSSTNYTVQEPLSNFDVDERYAVLTLLRGGDLSNPFAASYRTLKDSAQPGVHYRPVNGTIHFDANEDIGTLTVPILASSDYLEVSFRVQLLTDVPVRSTNSLPRQDEEPSEADVVILNTPVTGVLFPDNPVVVSLLPNGSYATGTTLFYNAPLICIDPCDKDFEGATGVSLYTEYCKDQQIDSSQTKYSWYISSDGSNYQPVRQATTFTSFDGKVLEPVYLNHSINVHCSVQAVTTSGTQGGTRFGSDVLLSRSLLSPQTCEAVSPIFQFYESYGFTGHPEELLRLTLVLKHYENYVPLVSSRPFDLSDSGFLTLLTHPYSRDTHSCSNLVEGGLQKASFLSPLPVSTSSSSVRAHKSQLLYQHFNSSKCQWEFQVWLPLSLLTNPSACDAQLSDLKEQRLTLPLYYAYIHIRQEGGVSFLLPDSSNDGVNVVATWPSGHHLSIPFVIYPHTVTGDAQTNSTYIYPIMRQLDSVRVSWMIIFYSVSAEPVHRVEMKTATGGSAFGHLLYSSSSLSSSSPSKMVHQAWMLKEVPSDEEISVSLSLWYECSRDCTELLTFSWFISTTGNFEPQMKGEIEKSGERVEGRVRLQPYFHLREGYALSLDSARLLCGNTENTTCTHSYIWTLAHYDESMVDARFKMQFVNETASSFTFTFSAEPLHEMGLTGPFQLEMKYSIQHTSSDTNPTKSPIRPLTLSFQFSDPSDTESTTSGISRNIALLASSITIFMTAAILVVIVLTAVALHCRWQARPKRNAARQQKEEEADNCKHQEERCRLQTLKKSSSTTSFPTAEKSKTHLQQGFPERLRTTSHMTGQIDRGFFLSKSLPNLFLASSSKEARTRKRKPATNVKVKCVYTLQASLNKWRGHEAATGQKGREKDDETQDKESTFGVKQEKKKHQVCVIKNSLHASPIQVHVQPLTGEIDSSNIVTVLTQEPTSTSTTEL